MWKQNGNRIILAIFLHAKRQLGNWVIFMIKSMYMSTLNIFYLLQCIDSYNNNTHTIRWGPSPYLHSCRLSGRNLKGMPSWESNSGLPYFKPTHYHLSYSAPWSAGLLFIVSHLIMIFSPELVHKKEMPQKKNIFYFSKLGLAWFLCHEYANQSLWLVL